MTEYTPINPQHYRKTPIGIGLECIKYIRYLPHSQATAGKYIYRAGNKDPLAQDLDKALWYVNDALEYDLVGDLREGFLGTVATVDPFATARSRMFYNLITGRLDLVQGTCNFAIENMTELD